MISPIRSLDCAPVDADAPVRLSDARLRRIEPLQDTLLRPFDFPHADAWRRAVNRRVMAAFDSDAAMFQLDMPDVPLQVAENLPEEEVARYCDEIMPELARGRRLYERTVVHGAGNRSILWGRDLPWLYASEYFNEIVVPCRAFDPLWAAVRGAPGRYPATLQTYRDRRVSTRFFDEADVRLMALLRPALAAGVRAVARAAGSRVSVEAALDARGDGALVLDAEGRLLHRNLAARGLFRTARAERLVVEAAREMAGGVTPPPAPACAPRMAVGPLAAPENTARTVATRAGDFLLTAVRLGEGVFALGPTVLVTVAARDAPVPDRHGLRERFGLTHRQAEVALLLAARRTNPEIAEALCISPHTARRHTEAVMRRLGVHDRRDVEGRVRGPAPTTA